MQHVASQLRAVRQTGRLLLVLRRAAQLLTVLVPLAVVLGLADFALRMPGPMRLMIGLLVLGGSGYWLATRLNRALRFWPSLAELALRAERLYPQLSGSLASAVEFSLEPAGYAEPSSTAAMAKSAVSKMEQKSEGVDLKRMINIKPTLKACGSALLALAVLGALVGMTPQSSATAAQRWFMPLGDTHWPKVNEVQALTSDSAVFPADGKVRLRAEVTRGWSSGMRMTMRYRVLDESGQGEWMSVRVAEQRNPDQPGVHRYETMVDVPAAVARALTSGQRNSATLEVQYSAGDDTTPTQQLTLAARPEIKSVTITTSPPDYAIGLIGEQRVALHEQPERLASTSAYRGSGVLLEVRFNKPIPRDRAQAAASEWVELAGPEAGLELVSSDDQADGFALRWVLDKTVAGSFVLTDQFGLTSSETDKQFRVQALTDEDPVVVLLRPAIDESVLPGAAVQLRAMAEDDVAMRSLRLEVDAPDRANTPEDAEQTVRQMLDEPGLVKTGRYETLDLAYRLELAPLGLLPGDEVLVTAIGRDVYRLGDEQHDAVRSETRRLRVITERELADQVRRVLRGVRNTAQSLERNQRIVADRTPDGQPAENAEQQASIGRRITSQQETIDAVRERLDRNEPHGLDGLEQLLDRVEGLLDEAQQRSDAAEQSLSQAAQSKQSREKAGREAAQAEQAGDRERAEALEQASRDAGQQQEQSQAEAREAQDGTRETLAELIATLDMGESVGEIESELSSIRSDAERVARETNELLPKTIGQDREALPEGVAEQLDKNAERQEEVARRAEELIDKMRATAEEMAEQGETPEQRAVAKTLSEAADIAQRQGLEENAQQAAEQIEQNQVADAAARQQQAMSTLEQMLAEMGKQQERRQEELKRLLQELAQKLQQLVEEQREQLERAQQTDADAFAVLEHPQFSLRRRTMLVEAEAMLAPDTEPAGKQLGEAVRDQAEAVKAIRLSDKGAATQAETDALVHLEEALKLINRQQQEQQQEQNRQERFALRQAYYDLADRQDQLRVVLEQHERDQAYGRRDWRQINRLHADELGDLEFNEVQERVSQAADELREKAGEAIVYQSLHRRIDQASNRAVSRLSDRRVDGLVVDDQQQVALMLRAMGDALDDTGEQDKFEKDNEQGDPGGGGPPGGEQPEPPLVPDLAEIKLLRELMITLRVQTQAVDQQGAALSDQQRKQKLTELAQTQQELKDLGSLLIEKLQNQTPQPPADPRN